MTGASFHLRPPACRHRQGHGANLLREPHFQARPERCRAAEARRGVRRDHRRRGADEEGKAQDEVGRAGSDGETPETGRVTADLVVHFNLPPSSIVFRSDFATAGMIHP